MMVGFADRHGWRMVDGESCVEGGVGSGVVVDGAP